MADATPSENISAIAAMSKSINEDLFYDKMRALACKRGVVIQSRRDVRNFVRDSLLSREIGEDIVAAKVTRSTYADIDPISSREPGGSNYHTQPQVQPQAQPQAQPQVQPQVQPQAQPRITPRPESAVIISKAATEVEKYEDALSMALRNLPKGLRPVREDGKIIHTDVWIRLQCEAGHAHSYYISKLSSTGCHTCTYPNQHVNAVRVFLECATGYPCAIGSNGVIKCSRAPIFAYAVAKAKLVKVMTRPGGELYCTFVASEGCVDKLKRLLRGSKYILPDGRAIRDLLGDEVVSFDETAASFENLAGVMLHNDSREGATAAYMSAQVTVSYGDEAESAFITY